MHRKSHDSLTGLHQMRGRRSGPRRPPRELRLQRPTPHRARLQERFRVSVPIHRGRKVS